MKVPRPREILGTIAVGGALVAWGIPVAGGYHVGGCGRAGEATEVRLGIEFCKSLPLTPAQTRRLRSAVAAHPVVPPQGINVDGSGLSEPPGYWGD
jgi:hypothetical protein